jgi:hypothetical protein
MGSKMTDMAVGDEELEVETVEAEAEAPVETEIPEGEQESAPEAAPDAEAEADEAAEDEELIVSIGEEPPPPVQESRAPEWVRELRKSHRELQRRNRELEARLQVGTVEPMPVNPGKKPSLEEYEYDTDKYEAALASWFEQKRKADEAAVKIQAEAKAQQEAWHSKLESYGKAKAELRVRDYEDAEDVVQQAFDITQQGVLLQGAENPALVVYALGKNPKKVKELAEMKDPVKFAFAVAKLETQLKVTNRKAAPPPERTVRATAPISGAVDSTLERLRAEAEKTGNYTKVLQYKKQRRAAAK